MNASHQPRLALVAAVAANGVIGVNGHLPWHLPADLQYFKTLTMGKRILMGRRTWESFPKPLPNREHVVVSSQKLSVTAGVHVVPSLAAALALPGANELVFVIGGHRLYAEALSIANDLYLTEIAADIMGDIRFPDWDRSAFRERSRELRAAPLAPGAEDTSFAFVHYERI